MRHHEPLRTHLLQPTPTWEILRVCLGIDVASRNQKREAHQATPFRILSHPLR